MTEREQLVRDGYCLVKQAIPPALLEWLRAQVQTLLPLQEKELDTMGIAQELGVVQTLEAFSERILRRLGYTEIASIGPTFINKKPFEGPRPWHHDWRWRHLAISQEPEPTQVGVVFYMRPTSPENGCLRVWPGSHVIDCNHQPEAFAVLDDEIDVTTELGDVVIFDSRLRHATHPNQTPEPRESVNMWHLVRAFDHAQPYAWQVQQ